MRSLPIFRQRWLRHAGAPIIRARRLRWIGALAVLSILILVALTLSRGTPTSTAVSPSLTVYNWPNDIPPVVLEGFTAEFGAAVEYRTYDSADEATRSLRAGGQYDVVVMEHRYIKTLIDEGLLAKLPRSELPNFEYVSPDFRNLFVDPDNAYSVPFSWGTTGIILRKGMATGPTVSWSILWDPQYAGTVGVWRGQWRDMISATLKLLGYSANSENPAELAAAREHLLALRANVQVLEDWRYQTYLAPLLMGQLNAGVGDVDDAMAMQSLTVPAEYFFPAEGALLWGDSLIIPATSEHPVLAAQFINYLLRPRISALFLDHGLYRMTNTAAEQYADPKVREDEDLYPPLEVLQRAELLVPLSPRGETLYQQIWADFLAAPAAPQAQGPSRR